MNWLYCPDGSDSYENFFGWFFGGVKQISTDSLFFVIELCLRIECSILLSQLWIMVDTPFDKS